MNKIKNFFFQAYCMARTPYFLKNLLGILLFLAAVFGLLFVWLNFYTQHGKTIQVPDFRDMEMADARSVAEASHVTLVVSDSIFLKDKRPGVVLSQKPAQGAIVKNGRKIYLSITKYTPDQVALPKVFGMTEDYKRYSKKLKRLGISTKVVKEVYNRRLASGTILKVFYKGKDISNQIEKGVKIPVGSTIGFIISRSASEYVNVPDLGCMSEDEAVFLLESSNLAVGKIEKLPGTTADNAYVIKQSPYPGKSLHTGAKVDLTVGTKAAGGCE